MSNGPLPPYGVPIRDAIARGNLREMKKLFEAVKPALEELEIAIRKMERGKEPNGPVPPYGVPIRDAIARGDLQEMKATADAARAALYGVDYAPVPAERSEDVRAALDELEDAIAKLERPR